MYVERFCCVCFPAPTLKFVVQTTPAISVPVLSSSDGKYRGLPDIQYFPLRIAGRKGKVAANDTFGAFKMVCIIARSINCFHATNLCPTNYLPPGARHLAMIIGEWGDGVHLVQERL